LKRNPADGSNALLYVDDIDRFVQAFRTNCFEVVEYSYTSDPEFLGTMILGSEKKFLERAQHFGRRWNNWSNWEVAVDHLVNMTLPTSFAFKINWTNGVPSTAAIYCRYINGVPMDALSNIVPKNISFDSMQSVLSSVETFGRAAIVGVRISDSDELPVSLYFDVRNLTRQELQEAYLIIGHALGVPNSALTIVEDMNKKLSGVSSVQFMGVDLLSCALKLDFPQIQMGKFLRLLEYIDDGRNSNSERFRMIARHLRCSELNYLGLKVNSLGTFDWKTYFSISQRYFSISQR
jgi:hypothetical protein